MRLISVIFLISVLFSPSAPVADAVCGDSAGDDALTSQDQLVLSGYIQFWCTALEQTENGLRQSSTGDTAARETSGFSIRRARLGVGFARNKLSGRLGIRLEGDSPSLQDAYVNYPVVDELIEMWGGQMKIPSTYEIAEAGSALDFLTRSSFSRVVVDYSLIRSPPMGAPDFAEAKMANRDLGLALKGKARGGSYFVMVGNGFGANRYVSGREKKQDILANDLGNMFYAARVFYTVYAGENSSDKDGAQTSLRIGGHASRNHHSDVVLEDEETVLDVKRFTWSVDLRADVADVFAITAMYGEGQVLDDYDNDKKTDYFYRGWELKAMSASFYGFRCGFRYDVLTDEENENGLKNTLYSYVAGINYEKRSDVRFQLNYKWQVLDGESERDIADDVLALCAQFSF